VYGGGLSVYMGGYSSSFASTGYIAAAVGDTAVRNASVRVDTVAFTSCSVNSATRVSGNSYGGSFSSYLGGYAWSFSSSGGSSSTSRSSTASGVRVSISGVNSSDCSATTTGTNGANSYGGSMSAVYIGAYTWSSSKGSSFSSFSKSDCGTTNVSGLVVSISSSRLANSSAVSRTFSQCPLVFNVPELTRVPLAECPSEYPLGSSGSNVSALGSVNTVPDGSYCLCACDAL
jgi:hypothetical protein